MKPGLVMYAKLALKRGGGDGGVCGNQDWHVLIGFARALLVVGIAAALVSVTAIAEFAQAQIESPVERSEFRRLLPLISFYSTPSPLPAGRPGELIRSEEFDEYQLPEGVSAVRILYRSRSANGEDVAASGVILAPDEPPPVGGWPVIAWAHGFTGTARRCAPSLMSNLNEARSSQRFCRVLAVHWLASRPTSSR